MHTAIVWTTASVIGVVSALASQLIAPMTFYGWMVFVGMIACVAAYGLFPSLKLRRVAIRWRHALRRARIRNAAVWRAKPVAHAQRLLIATAACSAAVIAYQTIVRPVSTGMETAAPMTHTHLVTAREWDYLRGPLVRLPARGTTTTTLQHADVDPAAPKASSLQPSQVDAPRPGWVRLIELLFLPSQPAA